MAIALNRRLFTIREFERMIRGRVFLEDERVELIEGEIVKMAALELPHMVCVSRLDLLLHELIGRSAHVWIQNAIHLPKSESRPQPDVVLLRWRDDLYNRKHPTADDVLLLIEVADSSVNYDRKVKAPLYARAGIPEYWLVNLPKSIVEVYTFPHLNGYQQVLTLGRGETLALPSGLPGTISVDDIFG